MKIALVGPIWTAVLVGGWTIWMVSQLHHVRPGVFGAERMAIMFTVWTTPEARKCG
jgi:hypothetical protein